MKFKKFGLLISFVPLLLTSCSSYGTHYVVKDLDSYYNDSLYRDFSIEALNFEMSSDKEFLVFFASTGCSACDAFEPEFKSFLEEKHYLTYKFDAFNNLEMEAEIINTYKGKFCQESQEGNYYLRYPSVFIVKGEDAEEIPYSRLKNKTMIVNTFNEYVHNCNVYYAEGNAIGNMMKNSSKLPFREFGYLAFSFGNESLLSYYKASLQNYINDLSFPVVVANYPEFDDYIAVKKGVITEDGMYGSKEETRTKDVSNLDYVKEVLNK